MFHRGEQLALFKPRMVAQQRGEGGVPFGAVKLRFAEQVAQFGVVVFKALAQFGAVEFVPQGREQRFFVDKMLF